LKRCNPEEAPASEDWERQWGGKVVVREKICPGEKVQVTDIRGTKQGVDCLKVGGGNQKSSFLEGGFCVSLGQPRSRRLKKKCSNSVWGGKRKKEFKTPTEKKAEAPSPKRRKSLCYF